MSNFTTNIKENALVGIANGAKIANNVAKRTMGPKGINVAIEMDDFPFSISTDDGATVIEHLHFTDPLENRGLGYLKEGCARSNDNAFDGSTATCGILTSILDEGANSTEREIDLKNSIDAVLPDIDKKIKEQTRPITVEEIEKVGTIAGKSKEKGKKLAEIYKEIGKDGIIHYQGSGTFETSFSVIKGVRFKDAGYLSPFMVYDEEARKQDRVEKRTVYENPIILVTKRKIEKDSDLESILNYVIKENKPLVIFTDDMDSGVATRIVAAHRANVAKILIIKAPVIYKGAVFEDFAKCTGSTILEDAAGVTFKSLPFSALGTCDTLITTATETVLIGTKDISGHIADLQSREDNESKIRLSWLTPRTAFLKIGSMSETDLSYHMKKYEDAIGSCQHALQSGVVAGGGIALYNISKTLPDTIGGRILAKALQVPLLQLLENSGIKADFDKIGGEIGYDLNIGEIVNMFDAGLVDSSEVINNEVKNAVGIASTAITTPFLITKPEESPEMIAAKVLQGKGMRPF